MAVSTRVPRTVLALFALFLVPALVNAGCYPSCRFSFCPDAPGSRYALGRQDVSLTAAICDPTGHIAVGHVDETGEAYVSDSHSSVPISQYRPAGLKQNYSPSFFKSFSVGNDPKTDLSGVGHETLQQNQAEFLDGKCIVLPLRAYQILNKPGGYVIDNKHPRDNPFVDCVSFTVTVPSGYSAQQQNNYHPPQQPQPQGNPYPQGTQAPQKPDYPVQTEAPVTTYPTETEAPVTSYPTQTEAPVTSYPTETEAPVTSYPTETEAPVTTYPTETEAPVTSYPTETEAPSTAYPSESTTMPMRTPYEQTTRGSSYSTEADKTKVVTPPPMDSLDDVTCDVGQGCPATDKVGSIHSICLDRLAGRPMSDYWVFGALDGVAATGKTCGIASPTGKQLCSGTFQNAEWCAEGFTCKGGSAYRPQIVQCVSKDGEICRLSNKQEHDVIIEKTQSGSDFFVSCKSS